MNAVDVLVIGGGPAGTTAAIAAAQAGATTMLVEQRRSPRTKVCGCCLSDAAVAALHSIGAGDALRGAAPLRTVRLVSGAREVSIERGAGASLSRRALDERLAGLARAAGVTVVEGRRAKVRGGGIVAMGAGAADEVHAGTVVVADGIGGTSLDGIDGFGWAVAARSRIGIGAELPAWTVDCDPGEIRMHVSRSGYVGCVRLEDGAIDVAAAVTPAALRSAGSPADYARTALGACVRDEAALRAARWSGTPLLTRRRRSIAARGILVAGDAAGYVEPFTGEGMGWAIMAGIAAGRHASTCVRTPDAWRAWPEAWRGIVGAPRLRCRMVALALRQPALVMAAIAAGAALPGALGAFASAIGRRPVDRTPAGASIT